MEQKTLPEPVMVRNTMYYLPTWATLSDVEQFHQLVERASFCDLRVEFNINLIGDDGDTDAFGRASYWLGKLDEAELAVRQFCDSVHDRMSGLDDLIDELYGGTPITSAGDLLSAGHGYTIEGRA